MPSISFSLSLTLDFNKYISQNSIKHPTPAPAPPPSFHEISFESLVIFVLVGWELGRNGEWIAEERARVLMLNSKWGVRNIQRTWAAASASAHRVSGSVSSRWSPHRPRHRRGRRHRGGSPRIAANLIRIRRLSYFLGLYLLTCVAGNLTTLPVATSYTTPFLSDGSTVLLRWAPRTVILARWLLLICSRRSRASSLLLRVCSDPDPKRPNRILGFLGERRRVPRHRRG